MFLLKVILQKSELFRTVGNYIILKSIDPISYIFLLGTNKLAQYIMDTAYEDPQL